MRAERELLQTNIAQLAMMYTLMYGMHAINVVSYEDKLS